LIVLSGLVGIRLLKSCRGRISISNSIHGIL
jgi:hypothetical protein